MTKVNALIPQTFAAQAIMNDSPKSFRDKDIIVAVIVGGPHKMSIISNL